MVDIKYIKENIKEGFQLNPNEKIVNGIINGINRNLNLTLVTTAG